MFPHLCLLSTVESWSTADVSPHRLIDRKPLSRNDGRPPGVGTRQGLPRRLYIRPSVVLLSDSRLGPWVFSDLPLALPPLSWSFSLRPGVRTFLICPTVLGRCLRPVFLRTVLVSGPCVVVLVLLTYPNLMPSRITPRRGGGGDSGPVRLAVPLVPSGLGHDRGPTPTSFPSTSSSTPIEEGGRGTERKRVCVCRSQDRSMI